MTSFADWLEAMGWQIRTLFGAGAPLEVRADDKERLEVQVGRREIVADAAKRDVREGDRILAPFQAILVIEISYIDGDDYDEAWDVALRLMGGRRVPLARLRDQTDASILAAKLSTVTGKKVVSLV